MDELLSREEMQAMDRLAIEEIGIPSLVLMEVAGRAVADAAHVFYAKRRRPVLAVAGLGNNGGDAVVAARHLSERGVPVVLVVLGPRERVSKDLETQLSIAEQVGLEARHVVDASGVMDLEDLVRRSGAAIDGVFGTGLVRPVSGVFKEALEVIERSELEVIAVDMPSGVDANTGQVLGQALHADVTVTFQFRKLGQVLYPGREYVGELVVADIGIPPSFLDAVAPKARLLGEADLLEAYPPRPPGSHKGSFGHLLVVAGTRERPGAAILVARAALRSGAGLATIASDGATVARLAPAFDEVMGLSVGADEIEADQVLAALERRTALAIGPSLEPDGHTQGMVRQVLEGARVPAVVDAGALSSIGRDFAWLRDRRAATVLTPHPGEMARLVGRDARAVQEDRVRVAREVAERSGAHVVLKGAATVVAHPDGRFGIVAAGNPGMASGGTGDALTGVIGSLLAQGVEPGLAARAGAYLHARAGDHAAEATGEAGLLASDLIAALPAVIRDTEVVSRPGRKPTPAAQGRRPRSEPKASGGPAGEFTSPLTGQEVRE